VTTGAVSRAKFQSYHFHQQTNIQLFTGRMPFLSSNQQCQSTEGKNITFHGLAYPNLTWGLPTLSLTTNSSSLPWGWVAMPLLISPVMPVPQFLITITNYKQLCINQNQCLETVVSGSISGTVSLTLVETVVLQKSSVK